ncbi:hypothetical protein ACA910_016065 [Epithemia clementina (nom. ined.)]
MRLCAFGSYRLYWFVPGARCGFNGKLKAHEADTTTSKAALEHEIMSSSAAILNKDVDDGYKDNKAKDAAVRSGTIESKADGTERGPPLFPSRNSQNGTCKV